MINAQVFESFPSLATKRLLLREITLQDAKAIFCLRNNIRVSQFIARPELADIQDAKVLIEKINCSFAEKKAIGWAGTLRTNGQFIGACGFNQIDTANHRAEIGGELAVEQWGKFIAFEALHAIVNFGFTHLNLHSIEAKVQPSNRSAIYLLEKLGFKKEAHFTDYFYFENKYHDLAVYCVVKNG